MNIVIPAAGRGTRFADQGFTGCKPLLPIFHKPMIRHVIDHLNLCPDDAVFIIYSNDDKHEWDLFLLDAPDFVTGLGIDGRTGGAAETVLRGLEMMETNLFAKPFVVMDSDAFYTQDILDMYRSMYTNEPSGAGAIFYINLPQDEHDSDPMYSFISMDRMRVVHHIAEKRRISHHANTGIYCFPDGARLLQSCQTIVRENLRDKNEFYMSCVVAHMIQQKTVMFRGCRLLPERVFNTGIPALLSRYEENSRILLFDLDGTLVITDDVYYDVWCELLKAYRIYLTPELFDKYIRGKSDASVVRNLLPKTYYDSNTISDLSKQKDALFMQRADNIRPVRGASAFIRECWERGHQIAIVTNCNRSAARLMISNILGIDRYVETLIIGNECRRPKPFPDPYQVAIDYFRARSASTLIFEDSTSGILSGRGVQPALLIGISSGMTPEELIRLGVNVVIPSFDAEQVIAEMRPRIDMHKTMGDDPPPALIDVMWSFFTHHSITNLENDIVRSIPNCTSVSLECHKLKGGFIADVLRGMVTMKDHEGMTKTIPIVAKMQSASDTSLSDMASCLDLHNREYYFYSTIRPFVPIPTPSFYGLVVNKNLETIGVVMEDLFFSKQCEINLDLSRQPIETTFDVIRTCAKLHSHFWGKNVRNLFPQLARQDQKVFMNWTPFLRERKSEFLRMWGMHLDQPVHHVVSECIDHFDDILKYLCDDPTVMTLCHGDVKSPNIFYRSLPVGYECFLIDWQYVFHGMGVQDIVFFLMESFEPDVIDTRYRLLLDYYFIQLEQHGIPSGYSYDRFRKDANYAIVCFPLFVAVWFGTLPEDMLVDKNFPYLFIRRLNHFLLHLCDPQHLDFMSPPKSDTPLPK